MTDILNTLSFFNILKQPLTLVELTRFKHGKRTSVGEVYEQLQNLQSSGKIIEREGLYGLSEQWIDRRIKNDQARNHAWKRIEDFLPTLTANPHILAVAVTNSCAFNNMTEKSDIDLFIVTKKNRAWLARLGAALPAKIKRIRPGETDTAPICLSFFADETALNMEPHLIQNDIYFAHWADSLIWIYDKKNIQSSFCEQNIWAQKLLKRSLNTSSVPFKEKKQITTKLYSLIDSDASEKFVREKQIKVMPEQLRIANEKDGSAVILGNHIIKMHLDDRRGEITKQYMQLMIQSVYA